MVLKRRMGDESDRRVRELIDSKRPATEAEVKSARDRIAKASFASRLVRVDKAARGQQLLGRTIEKQEPSLIGHLAKRVLKDGQCESW